MTMCFLFYFYGKKRWPCANSNRINHQRWTSFSSIVLHLAWEFSYTRSCLCQPSLAKPAIKLPTISQKKLRQCMSLLSTCMTFIGDTTFSSSSNEICFGLYASKGPVLDSAFVVSMISHSWSSFTFATSLLKQEDQLLSEERTWISFICKLHCRLNNFFWQNW